MSNHNESLAIVKDGVRFTTLTCQGGLVKLYVPKYTPQRVTPPVIRGKVIGFSKRSRKRLLELTARMRDTRAVFVTLTYGQLFPDCQEAKKHLDNFLKRLKRAYPQASSIWRLELQDRLAPHFHLIIYARFIPKEWIQTTWGEVIGVQHWDLSGASPREPFTRIERIKTRKHLRRYVSKYVAKAVDLPSNPEGDALGFNAVPYLTVGRVWGIHNKECLPFDKLWQGAVFVNTKAVWDIKRGARKVWKGVNKRREGFALFVEDAFQWFNYFVAITEIVPTPRKLDLV